MRIVYGLIILWLITPLIMVSAGAASPKIVAISSGPLHCLALGEDGSVWEWGSNWQGELTGVPDNKLIHDTPRRIPLTNIIAISAGASASIALKEDGTVWWWGSLPNEIAGGDVSAYKIVQVPIANATSIYAGAAWAFAVKTDGTVWAWGVNVRGYLGNGDNNDPFGGGKIEVLPVPVLIQNITSIDGNGCFAVKNDGAVYAWGENTLFTDGKTFVNGKLGDFSNIRIIPVPEPVDKLSGIKMMSSGNSHTLALKDDGTVWAWGTDYNGQLGDGGRVGAIDKTTGFKQVQSSPVKSKVDNVKMISAYFDQSMALKNDGTVLTWGTTPESSYGSSMPTKVNGLADVIAISAGDYHYMALKSDGTVWVWGDNDYGQAGSVIGGQSYVRSPVNIKFDYSDKMQDALIVPSDALDLQQAERNNTIASITPIPVDTSNISIQGPTFYADSNGNASELPQGNGLVAGIAGVLILIVLIVGIVWLIKRK